MRTFLAFDIEEDVKGRIIEMTERLRSIDPRVRWMKHENMHVTVYFFGEVDVTRIPDLERIGRDAIEGVKPFSIRIQGISAFPNLERARVIWFGIHNEQGQLGTLYDRIREGLRGTGIVDTIEKRPYTPHLTAGRVRERMHRKLIDQICRFEDLSFGISAVSEFILFKSTLTPKGPIYEKLARFSL